RQVLLEIPDRSGPAAEAAGCRRELGPRSSGAALQGEARPSSRCRAGYTHSSTVKARDVEAVLRDFDMPFTSAGLPSEHLSHFALVLDGGCALDPTLEDSGNMKGLLILTSAAAVVA